MIDLTKYQNIIGSLYPIVGGGEVIAQEIDGQNRLIYIINNDGLLSSDLAVNVDIIPTIKATDTSKTIVRVGGTQ